MASRKEELKEFETVVASGFFRESRKKPKAVQILRTETTRSYVEIHFNRATALERILDPVGKTTTTLQSSFVFFASRDIFDNAPVTIAREPRVVSTPLRNPGKSRIS